MSRKPKTQKEEKAEKDSKAKAQLEELLLSGLEEPGLTFDKTGYAFLKLSLAGRSLDSIHSSISGYKHICYIDLSSNNLSDFTVFAMLPNLIDLNLKHNSIKDLKPLSNIEEGFPFLQNLDLSENKIAELTPIKCPRLLQLDLSENRIDKGETFDGHPKLLFLSLRKNRLTSAAMIKDLPSLTELYLSENKIKVIGGYENMGNLKILHLRGNSIDTLGEESFPALDSLEYLNLRANNISKFEEIFKLKDLPKLKTLIFSFNPIISNMGNTYFYETLKAMPNLIRINKFEVTNKYRQRTWNYYEEKYLKQKKEEEEKRLAEEEEERRRQELENQENA